MTLREKLQHMAKLSDCAAITGIGDFSRTSLALAAARLALEHAAKHCDRVARNQRSDWQGRVDGPAECAAAIRAEGKTLGADA